MSEARAYDMGKFWRLVSVDGGRVIGTFWVSVPEGDREGHVKTVDVTVWDGPQRNWGRVLYSHSLTAFVKGDEVRIPEHMIDKEVRADVLDAMDDMQNAVRLSVRAAEAVIEIDRKSAAAGERGE